MVRPGAIAFPVILALGAVTGYLTYTYFYAAIPQEGLVDSPYRQDIAAPGGNQAATTDQPADTSQFSDTVKINILKGSATQGSPDYEPEPATASSDALVTWVNVDTTLHTATSGKPNDPESGKLFDSGFLNPEGEYSIAASEIGAGEHEYYCQVHPYMTSTITIE